MQRRLSDYLQYEMYHVLGAYGVAERKLEDLERRLRKTGPDLTAEDPHDEDDGNQEAILKLVGRARAYNAALGASLHKRTADVRHPIPSDLPLTQHERFDIDRDPSELESLRTNPWKGPNEWSWIPSFYDTAIHVLDPGYEKKKHHNSPVDDASTLATNLVSLRDGLASGTRDEARDRKHRRARYEMRRELADEHLLGLALNTGVSKKAPSTDVIERVATDNLSVDPEGSLPFFVINAQAEAHLAMHAIEAWQSMPLGTYAGRVAGKRQWLESELDRCIALGTFVYCVTRSAPWIFAENSEECREVFENFSDCWRNVVPTRCMWLAGQLSLLALHRRAYARALKGDHTGAYNDYHKLQRQIRDMRRRIQSAPIRVAGAHAFLFGLDAQAHHHIGELYRLQHAHKPAVKHLRSASHGLEQLAKDDAMKDVLVNSRWNVQLQVSQGKANYELGHHKEGLCWHLRGWREFLHLLAADTGTRANVAEVTRAIKWLTEVRYEPELLKSEIQEYMRPVVDQLEGIAVADHLGALAADILLRLGHLLFVLNIGRATEPPEPPKPPRRRDLAQIYERDLKIAAETQISETLAFKCLTKGAECDRRNTLVGADMLKTRLRFRSWFGGELPSEYDELLMPQELDDVAHQWPGGSDDYENLARVAEYLMLRAQLHASAPEQDDGAPLPPEKREDADIARDLLMFFFVHTDSINVRKSQVHTFLMRERQTTRSRDHTAAPAIEFICMRRYSSAFPLLPRPSTFRALGGGYFVRLHGDKPKPDKPAPAPFGIVIDPGVDFIENLYRTGYSLSDIDMIIVTHDHVDHLGSLDPLLSLLHAHSLLREKQWTQSSGRMGRKLVIYVNKSVKDRYASVKQLNESNAFRPLSTFASKPGAPGGIRGWPAEFEIHAMSSKSLDKHGHLDLSKQPAYGVCIRDPNGPSIAITGDTPCPPDPDDKTAPYADWHTHWEVALESDLFVCHLSTVPLTELRKLARIDATQQPLREQDRLRIHPMASRLDKNATRALAARNQAELKPFRDNLEAIQGKTHEIFLAAQLQAVPLEIVDGSAKEIGSAVEKIVHYLEHSDGAPDLPPKIYEVVDEAKTLLDEIAGLPHDVPQMARSRRELQAAEPRLQGQIEFALWLRSHQSKKTERYTADLLRKVNERWHPPPQHPYLSGVIRWAREYKRQRSIRSASDGLLVIGELSEELGTLRTKIAMRLNSRIFSPNPDDKQNFNALTSDIGLQVLIGPRSPGSDKQPASFDARVLCTICDLDTDRVPSECFHPAHQIHEVCVKGENEGIFYNCGEHDPATQRDPVFLEQLERFDIFGR